MRVKNPRPINKFQWLDDNWSNIGDWLTSWKVNQLLIHRSTKFSLFFSQFSVNPPEISNHSMFRSLVWSKKLWKVVLHAQYLHWPMHVDRYHSYGHLSTLIGRITHQNFTSSFLENYLCTMESSNWDQNARIVAKSQAKLVWRLESPGPAGRFQAAKSEGFSEFPAQPTTTQSSTPKLCKFRRNKTFMTQFCTKSPISRSNSNCPTEPTRSPRTSIFTPINDQSEPYGVIISVLEGEGPTAAAEIASLFQAVQLLRKGPPITFRGGKRGLRNIYWKVSPTYWYLSCVISIIWKKS